MQYDQQELSIPHGREMYAFVVRAPEPGNGPPHAWICAGSNCTQRGGGGAKHAGIGVSFVAAYRPQDLACNVATGEAGSGREKPSGPDNQVWILLPPDWLGGRLQEAWIGPGRKEEAGSLS